MERWRWEWRNHFAPQLPTKGLEALRKALLEDDPQLVHGFTAMRCMATWEEAIRDEPAGACALGFALWKGEDLGTCHEIFDRFSTLCASSWETPYRSTPDGDNFISWFDGPTGPSVPRKQVLAQLLPEVSRELARRAAQQAVETKVLEAVCD